MINDKKLKLTSIRLSAISVSLFIFEADNRFEVTTSFNMLSNDFQRNYIFEYDEW